MPEIIRGLRYFTVVIFFLFADLYAQQPDTNLDIFYIMVDSSVTDFISEVPLPEESFKLDLNLGENYSVFNNKVLAKIFSFEKKVSNVESDGSLNINYVVNNATVTYGEIFRDGFFGEYCLQRNLFLDGSYAIEGSSTVFQDFKYSYNDTIKFDDIQNVENESFPFTKGEVPSEPFLSSLFEPIVAVGAAALAVILFFTVRSK